jgi:NDP-sugar pyrophosphorylase family protein
MLPVAGRPLLEWVVLPLLACGIRDFVLAVSHLGDQIENYCRDGARWGARMEYSFSPAPGGKAGEIWRARHLLGGEVFLVVPGDTICHLDYRELLDFHRGHGGPATVAFSTRYQLEVGTARVDERGLVREFRERPNLDQPVSTGAYVLDGRIYSYIGEFDPERREVDLPADVFPRLLQEDISLYGYVRDYAWWDVGRIADYERLLRLTPGETGQVLPWRSADEHFQTL